MRPVIIGIGGGTGSGKTTVARAIQERVGRDRIELISHDSYYRNFDAMTDEERRRENFDHPDSFDTDLLVRHLDVLRNGAPVEIPRYEFKTHARSTVTQRVDPRRVVILEGILVLADTELRKRLDIKLFVDTPADIRFVRRLNGDRTRGRTLESVVDQYLSTVRPMHEEFVEPSRRYADLIIPNGGENRAALDTIIARIEQLIAA